MSESAGKNDRSRLEAILVHLSGEANGGWFRPDRFLLDCAGGSWLAYAFAVFRGHEGLGPVRFALTFGVVTGLGWCLCGGHGLWRGWRGRLGGGFAVAGLLALAASWLAPRTIGSIPGLAAGWLAGAALVVGATLRLVLRKLYPQPGWPSLGEATRWLALLAAAVWLMRPFYTHRPIGAGDAYWYSLMLSDFVEQVRAGQFPVWAGVTEYAFNGAVSPLRLAPWFQHVGALLDLVTAQSLPYLSLQSLLIAMSLGLTGLSSYFFLRAILPRQPLLACGAALVCIASPGVLNPLYGGDQYMTFLALPFLPAVCYGLWRVAATNDIGGHLALAAGISGLWLAHPPIAFWTSALASLIYGLKLAAFRGPRALPHAALGGAIFVVLGSLPLVSVLLLDNAYQEVITGHQAAAEVLKAFPAIFLPFGKKLGFPSDNQPGYAVVYVLIWGVAWLPWRRRPGTLLLFLGVSGLLVLFVPVPHVTVWFWEKMPSLVMQATNSWPMQRLVPIWIFFVVFLFAAVHRQERMGWTGKLFLLGLLPLLGWSGSQANRLVQWAYLGIPHGPQSHIMYEKHNLLLSRYPFVSFASIPGYFSHGYMDPVLEHRLLRKNLTSLATNIESAAHKGALPAADPLGTALVAHGTFRAVNDLQSTFYNLAPSLALPPDQLVLWLEPLGQPQPGYLQILGTSIFREYILPDSGQISNRRSASRAFGTLPGSLGIISLFIRQPGGETPRLTVILPKRPIDAGFDFARYELWRYDPDTLPVQVKSWIPYRLIVNSPEPAYLETPRLWLGGYRALINGRWVPVQRSPDNLAMFPVPAGSSDVTIEFAPPWLLQGCYWLCLIGWTMLLPAVLFWFWRQPSAISGSRTPATG